MLEPDWHLEREVRAVSAHDQNNRQSLPSPKDIGCVQKRICEVGPCFIKMTDLQHLPEEARPQEQAEAKHRIPPLVIKTERELRRAVAMLNGKQLWRMMCQPKVAGVDIPVKPSLMMSLASKGASIRVIGWRR